MTENLLKHKPTKTENNEIESVYENKKIIIIYPKKFGRIEKWVKDRICLLYTSPSPRDRTRSRMPSSA